MLFTPLPAPIPSAVPGPEPRPGAGGRRPFGPGSPRISTRDSQTPDWRHYPGLPARLRDSKALWSKQNKNTSTPMTMRVHQEFSVPWNMMSTWMLP